MLGQTPLELRDWNDDWLIVEPAAGPTDAAVLEICARADAEVSGLGVQCTPAQVAELIAYCAAWLATVATTDT